MGGWIFAAPSQLFCGSGLCWCSQSKQFTVFQIKIMGKKDGYPKGSIVWMLLLLRGDLNICKLSLLGAMGGCLWSRQEVRVSWESQRRQGEEAPQIWLSVNANVARDKNKEPAQSFGVAGGKTSSHNADRDGRKEPACWQSRPSTVGLLFQVSISSSLVGRY